MFRISFVEYGLNKMSSLKDYNKENKSAKKKKKKKGKETTNDRHNFPSDFFRKN